MREGKGRPHITTYIEYIRRVLAEIYEGWLWRFCRQPF